MSGYEVVKVLSLFGFKFKRQKGSHVLLVKENGKKIGVIVPLHKELKKGTVLSIIKKAGISKEEFISAYKKL